MAISWFCFFHHDDRERSLSAAEHQALVAMLRGCPNLIEGYIHTCSSGSLPKSAESVRPTLALELEFATVVDCEINLRDNAYLLRLADPYFLPSLSGAEASQQGMLGRHFPVANPGDPNAEGSMCTFLVHYPGPAEDEQAWHHNYLESHAWIMRKFPRIRAAAVYTPAVIVSRLPFRIATAMQRNKVVFDSAAALSEALASPVREEMRADMAKFPPYAGGSGHVPMDTVVVSGSGGKPTVR
jgi:uncharacterized protein (TIGR02118 family)